MRRLAWVAVALGVVVAAVTWSGLRVNLSPSMPEGIWLERTDPTHVYQAGDVVVVCPPLNDQQKVYVKPGNCPSGREPMVKRIVAATGDVVTMSEFGIDVNGNPLSESAPMPFDGAGRPLQAYPAGTYKVEVGQVWLIAPRPFSFDSRYLGPVAISNIEGIAIPVIEWN
jgi:conjugative transfer signal peptidase TraF